MVIVNYYYPSGEHVNQRVGSVTIEAEALVTHLVDKVKADLDVHSPIELFKVSFLWEDINPGSSAEPNHLTLSNLLRLLNGQPDPLRKSASIKSAISVTMMTGTLKYKYCGVLVVPTSVVYSSIRRESPDSLDLQKLFLHLEVESEDYEQVVPPVLEVINQYTVVPDMSMASRWTSPYNERRYPAIPSSNFPNLLLHHVFGNDNSDDSGILNSEFWEELEWSGSFFGVLLGAPQSGKTASLLRCLRRTFGIYLAAKSPYTEESVAKGYAGSNDLHALYLDIASKINPHPTPQNDRMLSTEVLKVVLSRMILLHHLCCQRPPISADQWLLLQLYPSEFAKVATYTRKSDIFHAIATSIPSGNRDLLRRLIWRFRALIEEKIIENGSVAPDEHIPLLPIVLDEAHHFLPVDHNLWVFTAWGRTEAPCMPFYTALMDCLADERIGGKVVVAGTGLRLNAPPAIGRNPYVGGVVRTVDTFFEEPDVASYLRSFGIHPSVSTTSWLRGRPGFAAAFASAVLQRPVLINDTEIIWKYDIYGLPYLSMKKVPWDLDEYFFTTFLPQITESVSGSHALWPRFTRLHHSSERLAADLWTRFKRAVFLQTYQSGFYQYENARDIELFESGVALICTKEWPSSKRLVTQLSEPILIWAANQYLENEAPDEMAVYLRQRLADAPGASGQGKIWEQSVPNAIAMLFKDPLSIENIVWQRAGYSHISRRVYTAQQPSIHAAFGLDTHFTEIGFAEWLANPSVAAFVFPENDAGPDVATITEDGCLVLVQCKFTEPPSHGKKTNKPAAFSSLASILPNTMYRPRGDAQKIYGQSVAIGKRDIYHYTRETIFRKFQCVVGVVLAYGGLAWPKGCKTSAQKRDFINNVKVPVEPLNSNGTTGHPIQVPWTDGMDALYVFEGVEQLEKLYDEEHLYFLSTLKSGTNAIPSLR